MGLAGTERVGIRANSAWDMGHSVSWVRAGGEVALAIGLQLLYIPKLKQCLDKNSGHGKKIS
jgi:hypothetical protein